MEQLEIRLGPWHTITGDLRLRTLEIQHTLYVLAVRNDGSGGWHTSIGRGPRSRQAYVPGVVDYREAERCASRWARRAVRAMVSA